MGVCGFFLVNGEIPESFFSLFLKHQREKVFSMGRSSVCQIETKNRKKVLWQCSHRFLFKSAVSLALYVGEVRLSGGGSI